MKIRWMDFCAILGAVILPAAGKPNLLVIVADDLGYADVGFQRGTIPAPHLDRLAATGVTLTDYEGGTRVCAAIRRPAGGLGGDKRFDGRIGSIDVLPTLLAAAGEKAPQHFDGLDLLPTLTGKSPLPERPWFSYLHQNADAHASVHLGRWKLVAHGDCFAATPGPKIRRELYELRRRLREFGTWQKPGVGPSCAQGRDGFRPLKDWNIRE